MLFLGVKFVLKYLRILGTKKIGFSEGRGPIAPLNTPRGEWGQRTMLMFALSSKANSLMLPI